jgi:protein-disulfide isomerase
MTSGKPGLDLLPLRAFEHLRGNPRAAVTLVEYGDYECPGCAEAYWIIGRLQEHLGDKLRFVYRHYAFARLHPHAELAAQAAEAAGAQGKFWEMHDTLFKNWHSLDWNDLIAYARRLDLDTDRFARELKSEMYLPRVREDFRTGVQNGVYGTPGIFVNGVRHDGSYDFDTLLAAMEPLTRVRGGNAR